MRKRIWQLHSWLGLLGALPLLVIGLTGSLLVFSADIDGWLHPEIYRAAPSPQRASLDDVYATIRAAHPGFEPFSWYANEQDGWTERFGGTDRETGGGREFIFDPHTGELRPGSGENRSVTNWLLGLHTSFFAGDWGVVIAGVFGVVLMASGLSGVWLYRQFWRHIFTLRWKRGARLLFSDLHKFIGITSMSFNLILGFSGALWNLPSVRDLFPKKESAAVTKPALPSLPMTLEAMKTAAVTALPGLVPRALRFPENGNGYLVRGAVPTRNPFASGWASEVELDPATGRITRIYDIRQAGVWAQFEDMLQPLHFGTFGGLPIKILYTFIGLTPGILGISGFLIWRSRMRKVRSPKITAF